MHLIEIVCQWYWRPIYSFLPKTIYHYEGCVYKSIHLSKQTSLSIIYSLQLWLFTNINTVWMCNFIFMFNGALYTYCARNHSQLAIACSYNSVWLIWNDFMPWMHKTDIDSCSKVLSYANPVTVSVVYYIAIILQISLLRFVLPCMSPILCLGERFITP